MCGPPDPHDLGLSDIMGHCYSPRCALPLTPRLPLVKCEILLDLSDAQLPPWSNGIILRLPWRRVHETTYKALILTPGERDLSTHKLPKAAGKDSECPVILFHF